MKSKKVLNEVVNGAMDTENLMVEVNELGALSDGDMEQVAGGVICDELVKGSQASSAKYSDPQVQGKSISIIVNNAISLSQQ